MRFSTSTVFASLAGAALARSLVTRLGCSEAERFGVPQVSPNTLKPGDSFTITSTFNCSAEKGVNPVFIDYTLTVPSNNNGHEPTIFLGRHDFPKPADGSVPVDTLTTILPTFPNYFADAQYNVQLTVTYPVDNGDGTQTLIQGGVLEPITLTLN